MLELVTKIFCIICVISLEMYTVKILLSSNKKTLTFKTIVAFALIFISSFITFKPEYQMEQALINILVMIIAFKVAFNESSTKTIISVSIFMIITTFADIINTSLLMNYYTVNEIRSVWYVMLLSNFNVVILILLVLKFNWLIEKTKKIISEIDEKKSRIFMIYGILIVITLITLFQNVQKMYGWNSDYIINLIIIFTFFILTIIMLIEKVNYDKLQNKHDYLFDYVQGFEDKVEEEQLKKHEYKNQLAVLNGLIKNPKAKEILQEMVSDSLENDGLWIDQLKSIPKGGIKGLLYYKLIVANNKKINITVDISLSVKEGLSKLSENQNKILTKLIGIYFDNAIEAAEETKKKLVALEIYVINNDLNIVFSNTLTNKDKKIISTSKRGISNKGISRGNGLYFANKMIKNNDWIIKENIVVKNIYIQKLIIIPES